MVFSLNQHSLTFYFPVSLSLFFLCHNPNVNLNISSSILMQSGKKTGEKKMDKNGKCEADRHENYQLKIYAK